MNTQMIKLGSVNFNEIVSTNDRIAINFKLIMIDKLNTEFNEQDQRWYVANLYIYMNYHPTNDYPINLDNVFKMLGFANKGNAMKTIKSNFTLDEDYKVLLFRTGKQTTSDKRRGHNKDDVMLNIETNE